MEALGEKLHSARENKGYSLEQVARDTNIARKYLSALEEENFTIFPGDPYLIGFLKNYSEYLGLNPEETIALYRNIKLQEQPAPIEELLDTGRPKSVIVLVIILLIAVVGAGGFLLYRYKSSRPPNPVSEAAAADVKPVSEYSYDITIDPLEERFSEGSSLQIIISGNVFNISVKSVTNNVILSLPSGEMAFNLGDEKEIDLNRDGDQDMRISVNDIDTNAKAAVIKMGSLMVEDKGAVVEKSGIIPMPGASNVASRNQDISVIMESENPEPFMVDVIFRGYTLIRYLADRNSRVEQYFDKGETFRLDVNREVMLWISNAGSLNAKVGGIEVNFGRQGEVSTNLIKWGKNAGSGKYELQMIPVY